MTTIALNKQLPLKHKISFIDLKAQQQNLRTKIDAAIAKVLDHGIYILGPEVTELENALAEFCGVKYAITCSDGTDALSLGLMAKGIGPKDAVFVPSFTFAATAEVVAGAGATPVFIDVLPDSFNLDPKSLEQGIQTAIQLGLKPRGIIPVDLFGQPADYQTIDAIAKKHQLWIMQDGAQSFGAFYQGRRVGNMGDIATTSFFPAKPLGCYGDGGAVFTNDETIAEVIKSLRFHGKGTEKYDNVRVGLNARLDTVQAAILLEKLKVFPEEINLRNAIAARYTNALKNTVQVPMVIEQATSVWAQYTIRLPKFIDRNQLIADLNQQGVPTMIYYPKPLHLQTAYQQYPRASENLLVSEQLANDVLSLPMHPYLEEDQQDYIIEAVNHFCKS